MTWTHTGPFFVDSSGKKRSLTVVEKWTKMIASHLFYGWVKRFLFTPVAKKDVSIVEVLLLKILILWTERKLHINFLKNWRNNSTSAATILEQNLYWSLVNSKKRNEIGDTYIFPKGQVASNKNAHKLQHHFWAQFFMLFHMVRSVLFQVLALNTL